ncbi:MAG TPA: adenylate/guanylate cyclase domain-containing protein [Herpetosiphonaceae bacterium]|nr:adenylate/guanylate cyclase domain-containing protein [Herpetosiphonaceae bacterium]
MSTPQDRVTEQPLLVAFVDLTGYRRLAAQYSAPGDLLRLMDGYFEFVGDQIDAAGGIFVKCLGDAALIVFSEDLADRGVQALVGLKDQGDAWLAGHGLPARQQIKIHYGVVASGPVGRRASKIWDVYGDTVNIAATLPGSGITLSPEAFRQLQPETRKLFKKHTPPVVYVGQDDRRPA